MVAWLSMVRIGRIVRPSAPRRSTRNRESPSLRRAACSRGVVRASSSMRSECSARLVQNLLPGDDVVVALTDGRGGDAGRVAARTRLGDPERLEPELPTRDLRQPALLLRLAAVPEQGAHRVHLGMAGGPVAAAGVDLLEDGRSRRQPQPAPAIGLRDQAGEIAGLTKRLDERLRIFASARRARASRGPESGRRAGAPRRGLPGDRPRPSWPSFPLPHAMPWVGA